MNDTPATSYACVSTGVDATVALGRIIGAQARPGLVIALVGPLGAGKTHFVKGVAEGLGATAARVRSPTFSLMTRYDEGVLPLTHIDFYRLPESQPPPPELIEAMNDPRGVCALEWADRFEAFALAGRLSVFFEHGEGDERHIRFGIQGAERETPDAEEGARSAAAKAALAALAARQP